MGSVKVQNKQCLAITLITKHSLSYNQYFKSSLIAKL